MLLLRTDIENIRQSGRWGSNYPLQAATVLKRRLGPPTIYVNTAALLHHKRIHYTRSGGGFAALTGCQFAELFSRGG